MASAHSHDHAGHDHVDHDYVPGQMDITDQKRTWDAFMKASWFGSLLLAVVLGYCTLVFGVGADWLVSLVGMAIAGGALGIATGMGGAWIPSIIGLSVLAVIVRVIIMLWGMAMG